MSIHLMTMPHYLHECNSCYICTSVHVRYCFIKYKESNCRRWVGSYLVSPQLLFKGLHILIDTAPYEPACARLWAKQTQTLQKHKQSAQDKGNCGPPSLCEDQITSGYLSPVLRDLPGTQAIWSTFQ